MTVSLYDATAKRFAHTIGAMQAVLAKALDHCAAESIDPDTLPETRLAADMLPLGFQIRSISHHSLGALQAVRAGVFEPPSREPVQTFAELGRILEDALSGVKAFTPDEVGALQGRDLIFRRAAGEIAFVGEDFLLSFSIPNFYFHAATAYDLLRMRGVPLGKRDYLGPLVTRPA